MDELIVKYLQGRPTGAESRRVESWREESAENRQYFEELHSIWNLAGRASPPVPSVPRPRAWALLRDRAGPAPGPRRRTSEESTRRAYPLRASVGLAAAVAALAIGLHLFTASPQDPGNLFEIAAFSTGPREKVTIRLGDGTIVQLAPSTTIEMDGTAGKRHVSLDGQAFFAVAHHEIPFTVTTGAGEVTVLGTRFDIGTREDRLRLVVVDGRVRVSSGRRGEYSQELGPSQVGHVTDGGRVHVSQAADVYALLDWMEGSLIFQSTPLERVAIEIEHRYQVPVQVGDLDLASRTVTAWFTDEPLEAAVTVICRAADVECAISEAGVRIGIRDGRVK